MKLQESWLGLLSSRPGSGVARGPEMLLASLFHFKKQVILGNSPFTYMSLKVFFFFVP